MHRAGWGEASAFTNFKHSTASHLSIFSTHLFPKPSEVLKYGSAVPSSGRERGAVQRRRQARTFESQIWGMAQPSCSLWDPFWTKRSVNLIQELRPWRGCLHTSKHRSVRFDQRGNQLLINKELLISQCHFSQKAVRPLLLLTTSVLGS